MIEGIFALAVVGTVIGASWYFRRPVSEAFALLRHMRAALVLLAAAALLYGAAQTREILWVDFETAFTGWVSPTVTHLTDYVLFAKLVISTWRAPATLSILLLAFCLSAINPDYYRAAWRKQGEDGINPAIAWLSGHVASLIFLAIVFYNVLAALNVQVAGAVGWVTFAINVAVVALPISMLGGFLVNFIDPIQPPAPKPEVKPQLEPELKPKFKSKFKAKMAEVQPAPKPKRDWAVTFGGSVFVLAFGSVLLLAFAACALGFVLFLLGAPLQYAGLEPARYFSDVIVILNLFLGGLMILLSLLGWMRGKGAVPEGEPQRSVGNAALAGWPLLGVLVLFGFALSFLNLNDNHQIRARSALCETPDAKPPLRLGLADAYRQWIGGTRIEPGSGTFPVYIVAAEGGGIYAAYHTALFLAAVQDRYPDFARHVFAISSVSGGSLGASVFTSLVAAKKDAVTRDWYWQKSRDVLSENFLSGLAYSALFTDLPATLLPCISGFCPGRKLDRALALEAAFDAAWRKSLPAEPDAALFQRSATAWQPSGNVPALLLNTTEVETGERVVISPFTLADANSPTLSSLSERAPCLDVSLATGAGLSARFPFLTPAGWYEAKDDRRAQTTTAVPNPRPANSTAELLSDRLPEGPKPAEPTVVRRRLVDGAYFDNSGITTALDVLLALQRTEDASGAPRGRVRFILLAIKTLAPGEEGSGSALDELLAPLRTMDSVRATRAESALKQAGAALDGLDCAADPARCSSSPATRVAPLATDVRLPLGWMLSENSSKAIKDNDFMGDCNANQTASYPALLPPTMTPKEAQEHKCALLNRIGAEIGGTRLGTGSLPR